MSERSSKMNQARRVFMRLSRWGGVSTLLLSCAPMDGAIFAGDEPQGHVNVSIRSAVTTPARDAATSAASADRAGPGSPLFLGDPLEEVSLESLKPVPRMASSTEAASVSGPNEEILQELYPQILTSPTESTRSIPQPLPNISVSLQDSAVGSTSSNTKPPSVVRVRTVSESIANPSDRPRDQVPRPILSSGSNGQSSGLSSLGQETSDPSRRPMPIQRLSDSKNPSTKELEAFQIGPVEWESEDDEQEAIAFDSIPVHSALKLPLQASQSIRFSSRVVRAIPESRSVCWTILSGTHEVSLIARSSGTSRVAVELEDRNGVNRTLVLMIEVVGPWSQAATSISRDISILEQTIREFYVDSQVSIIRNNDGSLIVTGTVDRESSARGILTMIRRICLVPVKDEILVRPKY